MGNLQGRLIHNISDALATFVELLPIVGILAVLVLLASFVSG